MAVTFVKLMTKFAYFLTKIDKIGWGTATPINKVFPSPYLSYFRLN